MKKINFFFRAERSGARRLSSPVQFGAYRNQAPRRRSAQVAIIIILIAILLSACASASSTTPIPTVVLGNNNTPSNNQSNDANSISASAVVVPVNDAQLSFTSVGKVTTVNVKVGDQVRAGDILVQLDTTILEAKVKEAEANVLAAEAQIRYLNRLNTDALHLESAQADLVRMQALLDSAKATLNTQSMLTAPFDGTIVSVDISPAETVVPGQAVILLGELSKYKIETTDLSERDVPRVQIGGSAVVFIEALGEEFSGKIIDIDRIGSTLGGDVVYTVTIDLDEQPQGLLWGMSADVQIQTGE
ncbi:MAG: efflux RND transporter periplasmic adaptor subunit [Anaerolineae bacterium]|nr:efflux RND transporter periplasmic adaptor subunit [Anaerolineae bacterium]MCI0610366.1 efflux RND transporter periplasmic adaptor subunit [Anaerolineae bacterium]